MEKAILPGLRMIGQHLLQVEKDDAAQTVWLKALTSVCGVLVGVGLVSLIAKKWMNRKLKRPTMHNHLRKSISSVGSINTKLTA